MTFKTVASSCISLRTPFCGKQVRFAEPNLERRNDARRRARASRRKHSSAHQLRDRQPQQTWSTLRHVAPAQRSRLLVRREQPSEVQETTYEGAVTRGQRESGRMGLGFSAESTLKTFHLVPIRSTLPFHLTFRAPLHLTCRSPLFKRAGERAESGRRAGGWSCFLASPSHKRSFLRRPRPSTSSGAISIHLLTFLGR